MLRNDVALAGVVPFRSAAVMLSSGVYGWLAAAVERSEFSALSAAVWLSPFEQANARAAAGSISSFLNILKPPVLTTAQRDGTSITGRVCANYGGSLSGCSGG